MAGRPGARPPGRSEPGGAVSGGGQQRQREHARQAGGVQADRGVYQRRRDHPGGGQQRPDPHRPVPDKHGHQQGRHRRPDRVGTADVHPAAVAEQQRGHGQRQGGGHRQGQPVGVPARQQQGDAGQADEEAGHRTGRRGQQRPDPGQHERQPTGADRSSPVRLGRCAGRSPGEGEQGGQAEGHPEAVRDPAGDQVAGDGDHPDQAAEQRPGHPGTDQQGGQRGRRRDEGDDAGEAYPEQGHHRLGEQAVAELLDPAVPAKVDRGRAVRGEEVGPGHLRRQVRTHRREDEVRHTERTGTRGGQRHHPRAPHAHLRTALTVLAAWRACPITSCAGLD